MPVGVSVLLSAHQVRLKASANVAASAATPTTAQLTAPAGKTSGGNFQAGFITDDTVQVPVAITNDAYLEFEFSVDTAGLVTDDTVDFFLTLDGQIVPILSDMFRLTIAAGPPALPPEFIVRARLKRQAGSLRVR